MLKQELRGEPGVGQTKEQGVLVYGAHMWLVSVWDSLEAQTVKRLPATWETQVQSLGREDPLEKEMATHSSTLA